MTSTIQYFISNHIRILYVIAAVIWMAWNAFEGRIIEGLISGLIFLIIASPVTYFVERKLSSSSIN